MRQLLGITAEIARLTRFKEWRAYIALSIFGSLYGAKGLPEICEGVLKAVILMTVYMALVYLVNNLYDIDTDSINPRKKDKNTLTWNVRLRDVVKKVSVALTFIGTLLSYLMLSLKGFINYTTMMALGIMYSARPVRLKERVGLDLLSHAFFFGIQPFLLISIERVIFTLTLLKLLLAIAAYSMFLQIRNHLEDIEYDRKAGVRTTAVYLGERKSYLLSLIFSIVFLALSILILLDICNSYSYLIVAPLALPLALTSIERNKYFRLMDAYAITFFTALAINNIINISHSSPLTSFF